MKSIQRKLARLKFRLNGGVSFNQCVYQSGHDRLEFPQSDISDHIGSLYFHASAAQPKLIVELGTRGGESTRILLRVAEQFNAHMLSVDINDCNAINVPARHRWTFRKADDVQFGRSGFTEWCIQNQAPTKADVIFIDTSHEYAHTCQEIATWAPHLSETGVMLFHDTNMGEGVYQRLNGTVGFGWANDRGVIRAIEEYLGVQYNEQEFFTDLRNGFLIRHYPNCNGLTVMQKLPAVQQTSRAA